jgi:hypothetical protein
MQHLPQLLGALLVAAPDDMRTAWQTRLSQVPSAFLFRQTRHLKQHVAPGLKCVWMSHGTRMGRWTCRKLPAALRLVRSCRWRLHSWRRCATVAAMPL